MNQETTIPLYAQIRNDLEAAKNRRDLDSAARDIGRVANMAHQRQLSEIYRNKKTQLK